MDNIKTVTILKNGAREMGVELSLAEAKKAAELISSFGIGKGGVEMPRFVRNASDLERTFITALYVQGQGE